MSLDDALTAYLSERAEQDRFDGVVAVTRGSDTLHAKAYGWASRNWRIPNTLDTRFDTASITKVFTGVSTLQLVERGLFDLDTAVIDYLGLEGTVISPAVTVAHLLSHTSGIADDAEEAGEVYEDLWRDKPNYSVLTTADFLPQFVHKPPNFAPGEGCRYNNVGFILLGLCIEKATGLTYRSYVQEHVFSRAGMTRSGFFRMDRANDQVAEGVDPIEVDGTIVSWKRNIYSYPPLGSPDGGSHVTAADLTRFVRVLRGGELLGPEMTEAILTPKAVHSDHEGRRNIYGFSLEFLHDVESGDLLFFQKEGFNAGVSAMLRYYHGSDTTVIVLSNQSAGAWDPVRFIDDLLLGPK